MYKFLQYTVRDYMTADPVTVSVETTLRELETLLEQHTFNGVPVVSSGNQLLGFVTKLDVLKAFRFSTDVQVPHYDEIMDGTLVEAVMTREPVTVRQDLPLTRVLMSMIELRNKCFPVADEAGKLHGVIAREDVLHALHDSTSG